MGRWVTCRMKLGNGHKALEAALLLCLGKVLREQRNLVEAEDCCRRCLAIREELYNSQHADIAAALTGTT